MWSRLAHLGLNGSLLTSLFDSPAISDQMPVFWVTSKDGLPLISVLSFLEQSTLSFYQLHNLAALLMEGCLVMPAGQFCRPSLCL